MRTRRAVLALRRSVLVIALCVIAGAVAGVVYAAQMDASYESRARVLVTSEQSTSDSADGAGFPADRVATYVEVVQSQLVASRVSSALEDDADAREVAADADLGIDHLRDHVTARQVGDAAVLELRYVDPDPEVAQLVAQAFAEALVATAAELEESTGSSSATITVVDFASFEPDPVSDPPWQPPVIGLLLGLALGLVITAFRALLDTRVGSLEDLAAITPLPVLGTMVHEPRSDRRRLLTDLDPDSARVEAFRVLRTNVQFLDLEHPHQVLVITSSVQEEGKSTTAVSLALTLARAGLRVVLVDGDLRRPSVASAFGIGGDAGVTTVLLGKVELEAAIWTHEATGLHVLPSGVVPPNAPELLQTNAMGALLDRLRGTYEVIVIDTAPLLPVTDAALLAAGADATLLVVRHSRTRRDQVRLSLDRLSQVDVVPVGLVLNDLPTGRSGGYGSYGSYAAAGATTGWRARLPGRR